MKRILIELLVALALLASSMVLYTKYKAAIKDKERIESNLQYYSNTKSNNQVLKMTVEELQESNDSLVQRIDSVGKLLKLKSKETKYISYVTTEIHDTLRDTIPACPDFESVLMPNKETTITIKRKDTLLMVIPNIRNTQTLFVQREKYYKYNNFFKRLIHFNFKKTTKEKFYIDNSNDLIEVTDERVIETENNE